MKKSLLCAAALVMTSTCSLAEDLSEPKDLPSPPLWTGFSAGLNLGGGWSNNNAVFVQNYPVYYDTTFPAAPVYMMLASVNSSMRTPTNSGAGFIGGVQIGYNHQALQNIVIGVEADAQGVASNGGAVTTGNSYTVSHFAPRYQRTVTFGGRNIYTMSKSLDYIGTVRGRIGYLVTPSLLAYATGGFAYGGANIGSNIYQETDSGIFDYEYQPGDRHFSSIRTGWTAGGGLEWMFVKDWSAKVEYLYYDLGTAFAPLGQHSVAWEGSVPYPDISGGEITTIYGFNGSARFNGNIVRAGVNYHFNLGALGAIVPAF
jgi:outer membrane immunogenic protein